MHSEIWNRNQTFKKSLQISTDHTTTVFSDAFIINNHHIIIPKLTFEDATLTCRNKYYYYY